MDACVCALEMGDWRTKVRAETSLISTNGAMSGSAV